MIYGHKYNSGSGGAVTGTGTPPRVPKWNTPSDLNDSYMQQTTFAGKPAIVNDKSFVAKSAADPVQDGAFMKEVTEVLPGQAALLIRDTVANRTPFQLVAIYIGSSSHYDIYLNYLQNAGDVYYKHDVSGGRFFFVTKGGDQNILTDGGAINLQTDTADINLNTGAANTVKASNTIQTADPGGGAGKWKLGAVQAGPIIANNFVIVEIDGIMKKIPCD